MNPSTDLSIVTTVTEPYARFLDDWAGAIDVQGTRPAAVLVVATALRKSLQSFGLGRSTAILVRNVDGLTCGQARNAAVRWAPTPWVMHLDVDDVLLPDALQQLAAIGDDADVIQMGYEHWWPTNPHGYRRKVIYQAADGLAALKLDRIASGCSPFRRALWERWHYPEHLKASWDYGLWLGFAHLGARFRPTKRPAFKYRQWGGSHWKRVGVHHHDDLLALRRALAAVDDGRPA